MGEMTFPFDTCEIPQKTGFSQPYSVIVNLIILSIILFFIFKTKTWTQFGVLFSILLFELSHTFSHMLHIPGRIEFFTTHYLSVLVLVSIFLFFYLKTGVLPPVMVMSLFLGIILLDAWIIYQKMTFILNIFTILIAFFLVLGFYYFYLSVNKKKTVFILILVSLLFLILETNEYFNCKSMLKWFPEFPFHILVESSGILPVYFICRLFYDM